MSSRPGWVIGWDDIWKIRKEVGREGEVEKTDKVRDRGRKERGFLKYIYKCPWARGAKVSKDFPSKLCTAAELSENKQQHCWSQRLLSEGQTMGVQALGVMVVPSQDPTQIHTSDWLSRSSDHFCHRGHLSLSSNVVSLEVQQHCSWLYQKAERQTPSFRSVIQSTARSMTPAKVPGKSESWRRIATWKEARVFPKLRAHPYHDTVSEIDSCFYSSGSELSIYSMSQEVGSLRSHKGPRASNQVRGLCGSILKLGGQMEVQDSLISLQDFLVVNINLEKNIPNLGMWLSR